MPAWHWLWELKDAHGIVTLPPHVLYGSAGSSSTVQTAQSVLYSFLLKVSTFCTRAPAQALTCTGASSGTSAAKQQGPAACRLCPKRRVAETSSTTPGKVLADRELKNKEHGRAAASGGTTEQGQPPTLQASCRALHTRQRPLKHVRLLLHQAVRGAYEEARAGPFILAIAANDPALGSCARPGCALSGRAALLRSASVARDEAGSGSPGPGDRLIQPGLHACAGHLLVCGCSGRRGALLDGRRQALHAHVPALHAQAPASAPAHGGGCCSKALRKRRPGQRPAPASAPRSPAPAARSAGAPPALSCCPYRGCARGVPACAHPSAHGLQAPLPLVVLPQLGASQGCALGRVPAPGAGVSQALAPDRGPCSGLGATLSEVR